MENNRDIQIVTMDNLSQCLFSIDEAPEVGFDTETYGLEVSDRLFALQIATDSSVFYFNFHDYEDDSIEVLDYEILNEFELSNEVVFAHNAKFDLHKMWNEKATVHNLHDTQSLARLDFNQHLKYGLDACLRRELKIQKNSEVEQYISKNKLYDMVKVEGKKQAVRVPYYWKVPFEIMLQYGCDDAWQVLELGRHYLKKLRRNPDIQTSIQRSVDIIPVCAKMERTGVLIDQDQVTKGWENEERIQSRLTQELTEISGIPYRNGPKWLREAFDLHGVQYDINPKTGNPVFDKRALERIDHPIAERIREKRRVDMYISTYYSSFRSKVDEFGIIHPSMWQDGTDTGRFSYSNPNLQNVPKEEVSEDKDYEVRVRSCIVPKKGTYLVAIDFSQQEFRLMLDYAGEKKLIADIMNGMDLHQATADMVGISRKQAKALNFGLLYGMGVDEMAVMLKISREECIAIRFKYFYRLPRVERFIQGVINKARSRKWIKTWTERRMYFPNSNFAYKAPNHLIQGGSADMVKLAMLEIDKYIESKEIESKMLIQVHDELLFEVPYNELNHVLQFRDIMKTIYKPMNGLEMDCSVEISTKSWGAKDMKEYKDDEINEALQSGRVLV